ncbi:MAG: hypothetical protein NTY77_02655 [Elusimicrobia bacterium]|nr:hypothetical protein [Elusimicrobiota bacterium]
MGALIRLLALCGVLAVPARGAIPSTATLRGIDVYRSETVTPEAAARLLGPKVALYVTRFNEGGRALGFAEHLKAELETEMGRLGDFAYAGMNVGRTVNDSAYEITVTFDVVDAKAAAERMPFSSRPKGRVPDPAGLLAEWRRYWGLCSVLGQQGEPVVERPACPALYCPWVRNTDEVKELQSLFQREVPAHEAELSRVLTEQAQPQDRAAAAYLLAYSTSAAAVVERMLGAVADPDAEVRAAALSVLADISVYRKDVLIDTHRLLPALDFPTTMDRSKALAVFAGLAGNPEYKTYLASRVSLRLVRLLHALDPSVRDLAYTVLGMVSDRSYPSSDFDSWEKWAREQSAGVPEKTETSKGTKRR